MYVSGLSRSAVKPGSISTAMMAKPTHGSAPICLDALYATISGRKTNTHCHIRFTNCQDAGRTTPGEFHAGMTSRVAISAMNVMNREAPSSAPRIGRNELDRNSKNASSHALLPRGPLARSRAFTESASSPPPMPAIAGSAMMSL